MAKEPLKLGVLLEDGAGPPPTSTSTPVNLNVLQDTKLPVRPTRRLRWIAAALLAIGVLGGSYDFLSGMRTVAPTKAAVSAKAESKAAPAWKEIQVSDPDRSAYSKPVQELMQYVTDLRDGRVRFSAELSGEAAARQFSYSRLFASAYEEMVLFAKADGQTAARPRIDAIIAGFERIVREEQAIDQLLTRKERHAIAIAYLRALQNGDVVFPGPRAIAPAPPVLLIQLMAAYPDVSLDIDDPAFASVYRNAREFAASRLMAAGEVFAHEVIGEIRREIVASAAATQDSSPPTECEQGTGLGYAESVVASCGRLRLSPPASRAVAELPSRQAVLECRNTAAARLRADLAAMQNDDVRSFCARIAERIQKREISFLTIID